MTTQRSWSIYVVAGLMALLMVLFGGFFLVWCGTLRFLFSGNNSVGLMLLIFPGLIGWMAYGAARDAWIGLPEAPAKAVGVLILVGIFVLVIEAYAWVTDEISGFSWWLIAPFLILVGLIWMVYLLSPAFTGHLIEVSTSFVEEDPYTADQSSDSDDDDWMYLGGA